MRVTKKTDLPLYLLLKNNFLHRNCIYAQIEAQALTRKETENVRHFDLKIQKLVEKVNL